MKIIEFRTHAKSRSDVFFLIPLGDVHLGTKNCDEDKLQEIIDWIKPRKNIYWLGMGDYCEYINYTDKRFDPGNLAPWAQDKLDDLYKTQSRKFIEYIMPIADRCMGLLEGNHERTIRKRYHFNVTDYIVEGLNDHIGKQAIENLSYVCMIRWVFSRSGGKKQSTQSVIIYATHGFGAGKYAGGKVNNLLNIGKDFEAQIYLAGHTHEKVGIDRDMLYLTHSGTPRLVARKKVYAITGTFYKAYEVDSTSYAEARGYPPTPTGVVKIRIEPFNCELLDGKRVEQPPHIHISE